MFITALSHKHVLAPLNPNRPSTSSATFAQDEPDDEPAVYYDFFESNEIIKLLSISILKNKYI